LPNSVDGYNDGLLNDYGTSVSAGRDGNAYVLGYSVLASSEGAAEIPVLTVISPIGRVLLRAAKESNIGHKERISQATILENVAGGARIVYAGQLSISNSSSYSTVATIGQLRLSSGSVPVDDVVFIAGTTSSPTPSPIEKKGTSSSLLIAMAAGICGLVAIASIVVIGGIFLSGRRPHRSPAVSPATPSERRDGIRARAHMENQDDI
jgi:hypothetical protein